MAPVFQRAAVCRWSLPIVTLISGEWQAYAALIHPMTVAESPMMCAWVAAVRGVSQKIGRQGLQIVEAVVVGGGGRGIEMIFLVGNV